VHRHHHHHHHHDLLWRCSSSTASSSGCVLWHITVHGTAPAYLADSLRLIDRGCCSSQLTLCGLSDDVGAVNQPVDQLSVTGYRAFPVAAARAWNSLPQQTRAASSLLTFRRQTKSYLFWRCLCWLTIKLSTRRATFSVLFY